MSDPHVIKQPEARPVVACSDLLGGGKYPDSYYLRYDPFEGDRDTDVKMQTVSIVKVRKERECWMGLSPYSKPHKIKVGQRARHERALVDGAWCGYYVCLPCIDAWLKDVCCEPPNEKGQR